MGQQRVLTARLAILVVAAFGLLLVYEFRHARALGIPTLTTMAYTGSLMTFGAPDNATHTMTLALFVAGANDGGLGSAACSANAQVTCVNGQFTIALPSTCVPIVQANQNLQAEVIVDNVPMGLVAVAAVPYAVEAGTAATAANATTVNGMTAAGGVDSATDLLALISATACRARAGKWTDGTGCTEYVTVGCSSCTWTTALSSCPSGRHLCTTVDLWLGGFASISAQGWRDAPPGSAGYAWAAGYPNAQNQIFYPWGLGGFSCSAGAAPMYSFTNGIGDADGAFGCYSQTNTNAFGPCCLSN